MKRSPCLPSSFPQSQRWEVASAAYDGGHFNGWQSQPDGGAVQDVIERCLQSILDREVRIHGSGRTDAACMRMGQVFHFDAGWKHGAVKLGRPCAADCRDPLRCAPSARPGETFTRVSRPGVRSTSTKSSGRCGGPVSLSLLLVNPPAARGRGHAHGGAVLDGRHDFRAFSASQWQGRRRHRAVFASP